MNAAARAINQSNLFNGQLLDMRLSRQLWLVLSLLMAVLLSALVVVYTINEYRSSFNQSQQLEKTMHELQLQWGQLLLEQASLATPARVEQLAADKLHMHLPADQQTFVLQSR